MNVKDMPCVTVEQVLRLREYAAQLEYDRDRLKTECWKEAYLAGMEHGHHLTVEGGYIPNDEEAAEDYVADKHAEEYRDAYNEKPTISIAQLKAEWKAEALEEAAELYGHAWKDEFAEVVVDIMRKGRGYIYPEGLTERANELRRQAEEDK